jgi:cytidylate kinase
MNYKNSSERLVEAMGNARRQWQARHETERETGHISVSPPAITIAVSREAGANGSQIAHAVGEQLGWPVFDRELLQRVASEMGLRASLLEGVDEKRKNWLQEFVEAMASGFGVTESAYVRHLLETLFSLAAQGECVIVGRGAAQVLPAATTLRVRLVGPLKDRIDTIHKRLALSTDEARSWIEKTEADRVHFVKEHFRKDPANPYSYDLTLNTSSFSFTECADLIVAALRRLQARSAAKHSHRVQG